MTLPYALAGLLDRVEGRVAWGATDLFAMTPARRAAFRHTRIAIIFRDFLLFEELGAVDNASLSALFRPRRQRASTEAIAGAATGLALSDVFSPAHGMGDAADDGAHGDALSVVGRKVRTGTPWDRSIPVPVDSVWEVHGLANGHAPDRGDQIGPPCDAAYFPGTPAVIVKANALVGTYVLRSEFNRDAEPMAFFPGAVLAGLYRGMGDVRQAVSLMSIVRQVLVAANVLLGLFILCRLFARQMALLRALGAPDRFLMAVVWDYRASLLTPGTLPDLGVGVGAAAGLAWMITERTPRKQTSKPKRYVQTAVPSGARPSARPNGSGAEIRPEA